MQPIKFPGSNVVYAENQPEYLPLPAKKEENGDITTCWELTVQEALTISRTRKLYINMMTFNKPLTPISPYIDEPQVNTIKVNDKLYADKAVMRSTLRFNFWRRLMFLFFPEWQINQNVYILDGIMPAHEADLKITHLSYWDLIKRWHYNKFRAYKGGMECASSKVNNQVKSQV